MDGSGGVQLALEGMPARLLRVTPARLATWVACPLRYRMTYLDRRPGSSGRAWAHHTLGAVVHLALRSLFDLPPVDRTPRAAAAQVDRHWSGEGFRDAAQAAVHRERARTWVADYTADLDPGTTPVGLERWVSVATSRIVAEGRVDRIDERACDQGSGTELVIVDYKTGRSAPTVADAGASRALALYAVAAQRTLRRPCTRVELHHLPTGAVRAWRHDRASLQRHVTEAEDLAAQAADAADALDRGGKTDALFPARPSPACSTCEVRRHCPEGQAAAPELPSWALL